jgi:tRNA pseudouridine55 synthase
MEGILLVDKPAGWTSHDVVAKVRSILSKGAAEKVKVGHTGTLDPMATGLLILVVGSYTKRAAEFSKLDKTYEAEITLGANSTTADAEGEISPVNDHQPSNAEVAAVVGSFIGRIEQVPPAYSAIKVGGQRAYILARAGKNLEIEPRKITIYELKLTRYEYPRLYVTARVSSGTYIRSLAEDIGQKLGYLSALRRTQVGPYDVNKAQSLQAPKFDLRAA